MMEPLYIRWSDSSFKTDIVSFTSMKAIIEVVKDGLFFDDTMVIPKIDKRLEHRLVERDENDKVYVP